MSYSKSYQTVIAGRVREDETSFFGLNKVATPVGTFITNRVSGNGQIPQITKNENMKTEYAGKIRPTDGGSIAEAMLSGSNNSSMS